MKFRKKNIILTLTLVSSAIVLVLLYINTQSSKERMDHQPIILYNIEDPRFFRALGHLLGPAILPGNRVQSFYNGDEIFPAMLKAIISAKKTITFESYIYLSGNVGNQFVEALTGRARAGVKVHLLVDWVGSQGMDSKYIERLEAEKIDPFFSQSVEYVLNKVAPYAFSADFIELSLFDEFNLIKIL